MDRLNGRLRWAGVALALIAAGLAVRLLPLGLPPFLEKYLGSVLWGAMVFAVVGALLPRASWHRRVLLALAIAVATELSRLHHTPSLDAFRLTLAGRLLLGRVFSVWNMVAYAVGIAAAAALERLLRRRAAG